MAVPAAAHQRGFNLGQGAPGHEDVDVSKDAAAGSPQPGEQVRGALEQDDGDTGGGERPVDVRDLPAHCVGLCLRKQKCCHQMCAWRRRHLRQKAEFVEGQRHTRQEIGAARLANKSFPLQKARTQEGRWVAQRQNDRIRVDRAHARRAASSNTATASSSAP